MKTFDIQPLDKSMQGVIQEKIDNLNILVICCWVAITV